MGTLRLGSSVVVPSVTVSGGSQPVIDPLSITPTTSQQTITATGGTDGYSPITVSAVTSEATAKAFVKACRIAIKKLAKDFFEVDLTDIEIENMLNGLSRNGETLEK